MDTLTVIFSGMLIFDTEGQMVHLVKQPNHNFTVAIGQATPMPVPSVAFRNLVSGKSTFGVFPILSLRTLAGKELKVESTGTKAAIPLSFNGSLRGWDKSKECLVDGKEWPSWDKVQWSVEIAANKKAEISTDGGKTYTALAPGTEVHIGNDYGLSANMSHVPMYANAVRDLMNNVVKVRACEGANIRKMPVRDPITCPPVSLQ